MKPPHGAPTQPKIEIWKLDEDHNIYYEYRIKNDITNDNTPIFLVQRRKLERHHVGNWYTYTTKTFIEKDEAQKIIDHLKYIKTDPKVVENPKNNAYIDKETATDLESIIDDRIKFVEANMHKNPNFLRPELQRLMEIFKTVQLISCGMDKE